MMKVTIIVEEAGEQKYHGDYDFLHNKDWDGIVRLMLDDAHAVEEEIKETNI